jgi:hypothetical protein
MVAQVVVINDRAENPNMPNERLAPVLRLERCHVDCFMGAPQVEIGRVPNCFRPVLKIESSILENGCCLPPNCLTKTLHSAIHLRGIWFGGLPIDSILEEVTLKLARDILSPIVISQSTNCLP